MRDALNIYVERLHRRRRNGLSLFDAIGTVSAEHEQRIRDFRALDERFTALTRDWLRARLCAKLPSPDNVSHNSEWGVLRREIGKKRAHLPLRELFGGLGSKHVLTTC